MPTTMTAIATVTVGAGGATGMDFTNVPQTYTDLLVVVSARTAFAANYQYIALFFNDNGSGYTARNLLGTGSAVTSNTNSEVSAGAVSANSTSSTFSNVAIYIPNYTSAAFKSYSADAVTENNGTAAFQSLTAGLWSNTSAITKVAVSGAGQTFVQHSTATLYGIKNS